MPLDMMTQADNERAAPSRRRTFGDVLAEIRADEPGGTAKGAAFERLVKAFLQQDALYSRTFSNVWLWSEWPDNPGRPDTGVDIVAELRSGAGLAAIQCKFYAPNAYIDKTEIDSFMTESGREGFVERIIVATTSNWSANALAALPDQQIPVIRIGPQEFDLSDIDWAAFRLDEPQTMARKEPKRKLRQLADVPFFVPAKSTRLLQLADFVANAIYGYYQDNRRENFDIISPRIDYADGHLHGLYHYKLDWKECSCLACKSRLR